MSPMGGFGGGMEGMGGMGGMSMGGGMGGMGGMPMAGMGGMGGGMGGGNDMSMGFNAGTTTIGGAGGATMEGPMGGMAGMGGMQMMGPSEPSMPSEGPVMSKQFIEGGNLIVFSYIHRSLCSNSRCTLYRHFPTKNRTLCAFYFLFKYIIITSLLTKSFSFNIPGMGGGMSMGGGMNSMSMGGMGGMMGGMGSMGGGSMGGMSMENPMAGMQNIENMGGLGFKSQGKEAS